MVIPQRCNPTRRDLLFQSATAALIAPSPGLEAGAQQLVPQEVPVETQRVNNNIRKDTDIFVYQTELGIQIRDLRVGEGPAVNTTILMHAEAKTSTGVPLFNTVETNTPILYRVNAAADSDRRGPVTPGLEDAIWGRAGKIQRVLVNGQVVVMASANNDNGPAGSPTITSTIPPMQEGGIRRVFVPAAMAYGDQGVSRFQAWQYQFQNPVPRQQDLLYTVEVLRCDGPVCCPQDQYPCQVSSSPN